MKQKYIVAFLLISLMINSVAAQNTPVLLFPKGAPGESIKLIEKADKEGGHTGGEPVLRVTGVSEPMITIYSPGGEAANGSAVIVCPGGGYNILAYDRSAY